MATVGILTRTSQEYLVRGPAERGKGGGVLLKHGDKDRYWESVNWCFRQRKGDLGHLVGGKGSRVNVVSEKRVGGCPQAPAIRLHWNVGDVRHE